MNERLENPVRRGDGAGPRDLSLRIAQVIEPGVDGAFRVVELLIKRLLDAGHEVSLAYSTRRSSPALFRLVERVQTSGCSTLDLAVGNAPELGDALAYARLARWLWRLKPQVVHAHSSKAGVLARTMPRFGHHFRTFYTPHAYYGLSDRHNLKAHFFNRVEAALAAVGTTLLTSQEELTFACQILGVSPDRAVLVKNCVDTDVFVPGASDDARRELGIPKDALVLGAVGRLAYQKDPETLYRAFARCAAAIPELYLLHVGEGELQQELSRLAERLGIAPRILRFGYFERTILAYRAMDGLILTSRYEGLSMVCLEALAMDLPLILSEVAGTSELKPQALSHCWTVPAGDVEGFAGAIHAWAHATLQDGPCNHRARAMEEFGVERWIARHLDLYQAS